MTINKIYIGAFGALKDHTLELNKGFNVFYGENEDGKSTVMSFIKMMFFGSGRKTQSISKNPRRKYLPFDGSQMGGRIYFEHASRRYCLEREFKNSDATDRVILRDLDLGTSENVPSDIGKHFFGLGEQAFERSVFIGNTSFFDDDSTADGELNARLSNIASTGDETSSYEEVTARIDAAINELVTQRHVGILDKDILRLEELKKAQSSANEAAVYREKLSQKVKQLGAQLASIKSEYVDIKNTLDKENDIRMRAKLQEYLDTKKELDELNNTLLLNDGKQIDSIFIGKVNFCLSKYDTECTRAEEKQKQYASLEAEIEHIEKLRNSATPQKAEELKLSAERIDAKKAELSSQRADAENSFSKKSEELELCRNSKKPLNIPLLILGIIIALASVAVFSVVFPTKFGMLIGCVIGILTAISSFVFRPANKAAIAHFENELLNIKKNITELKEKETELDSQKNNIISELNAVTLALNTDKAILEQKKKDLEGLEEQLNSSREQCLHALQELTSFYSRYASLSDPDEIRASLAELTKSTDVQKSIKLRLKYLSSDLGNISYETAAQKLEEIAKSTNSPSADFEALKAKAEELSEKGVTLSNELTAAMTELKSESKNAIDPEELAKEIASLEADIHEKKQFIEAAKLAKDVMSESFAQIRRSYGSELEKRTLDIFSQITGGKYSRVNVSSSLELEAERSGSFTAHSIEYLSRGTIDQAYLSLRLAVTELITEKERLPIMLDDSLSQYDDERAYTALKFLNDYSADTQTVLFTCHNSICDAARDIGASVKQLH